MNPTTAFKQAREHLLAHREDYAAAMAGFRWPKLERFNWAIDWFDELSRNNARPALRVVSETAGTTEVTFAALADSSTRVARFFHDRGVRKGDRILLMLNNVLPLWETMLAAMKLGAVVIPATTQLTRDDLQDRLTRGNVRHAVVDAACVERFAELGGALELKLCVGAAQKGFVQFDDARSGPGGRLPESAPTTPDDPLLLYFTSGTTAKPKLVLHTQQSYPVGHFSTMYWIGMREGDVHQNISSPGWAKHAWSSFFAPWNAGATVLVHDSPRFKAQRTLEVLAENKVNTLCAPPTVWRLLVLEKLGARPAALRELVSAGEPLNPEVIEQVQSAWGITIRDGYGQTETTAQIGNSPGQPVRLGSMGRPLPGYSVALLDAEGRESLEGEISLRMQPRPVGLMAGYLDDPERTASATAAGFYRTGDEASRDEDGYYHYVGRGDDVFKASDYRISPFELESALIEHPAVAEAAVVPSPDPVRHTVPKCFVVAKPGHTPSAALAREILEFVKGRLAPYKRIRILEFAELPKTISGKIRRVQLRTLERERRASGQRGPLEFFLDE